MTNGAHDSQSFKTQLKLDVTQDLKTRVNLNNGVCIALASFKSFH